MGFFHGMGQGEAAFILCRDAYYMVCSVGSFRLQRRQGDPAAGGRSVPGGMKEVAADGTDIELGFQHICAPVVVCHQLPG